MEKISTLKAPQTIGAYVQATICEGILVFISGQLPLEPSTGKLAPGGLNAQVRQAMLNIGEILKAADLCYDNLVKMTIYLTDMSYFEEFNAAYASFFTKDKLPARAVIQVSALPRNSLVEIEGIAEKLVTSKQNL